MSRTFRTPPYPGIEKYNPKFARDNKLNGLYLKPVETARWFAGNYYESYSGGILRKAAKKLVAKQHHRENKEAVEQRLNEFGMELDQRGRPVKRQIKRMIAKTSSCRVDDSPTFSFWLDF